MSNWIDDAKVGEAKKAAKIVLLAFAGQSRTVERYVQMAYKDPGTGIFNRRYFFEHLNHALDASQGQSFNDKASPDGKSDKAQEYIVFMDIVGLSQTNKMGQSAGDEVIQVTADKLQEVVRDGETVARIGGDEFAAIIKGGESDANFAANVIERFQKEFDGLTFEYKGQTYPANIYIAAYAIDTSKSADENMEIAGEQLAQAKIQAGLGRDAPVPSGEPDTLDR